MTKIDILKANYNATLCYADIMTLSDTIKYTISEINIIFLKLSIIENKLEIIYISKCFSRALSLN